MGEAAALARTAALAWVCARGRLIELLGLLQIGHCPNLHGCPMLDGPREKARQLGDIGRNPSRQLRPGAWLTRHF